MPAGPKGYIGHIALLDQPSQHIKEYGRRAWADSITVSCYIPASTGKFFMAKWSVMGRRKGVPYSVEFIRDGESVSRLLFDEEVAAAFHGGQAGDYEDDDGQKWYFVFREFTCAGEEGDPQAAPVSDVTGTLEIVIRDVTDGDMGDVLPSKERAASEGADHEGYKRAQALHGDLQDNHNIFSDWLEPKPCHTHHAEMVRGDGTIWKNRVHPLDFLPSSLPDEEQNIVARFLFYYTSLEQVKALTSLQKQLYVESDEICLLDSPPSKWAQYAVRSSVLPESPIKTEADRQKQAELDELFAQRSALNAKIEAKIQSFGENDEKKLVISNSALTKTIIVIWCSSLSHHQLCIAEITHSIWAQFLIPLTKCILFGQ
ncbi:hypothetical protein PILCRDRAFT_1541 [Piloderma croceum F 1598]|uniref:Uncharacterized protein n=1 Tax=Piloderma croceum (strain F 1598) TaxID=765440 RepID=A0A0C3CKJ2_PILCF|nr:hypothetical protein PILCRDRAFT_1541 [Piloderma croceum F 1598]